MQESALFAKFCSQTSCPAHQQIHKAFETAEATGEFNISGYVVDVQTCYVISQVFHKSKNIKKFNATDCFLPSNGLSHIMNSLKNMAGIKEVNLYGNNIMSESSTRLGEVLANNGSIIYLGLKWNGLGVTVDTFSNFCDGLAKNVSLQTLDLRCNQICAEGAKCLGNALKENTTLKYLDIRWNNLQSQGAEYLLDSLEHNKTLAKIKIDGNFIQKEITSSLEQCLLHNASMKRIQANCEARTNLLSKHIKILEERRQQELDEITETTQKRINQAEKKIYRLVDDMATKDTKIKDLTEKLSGRESDIRLEKQKTSVLEEAIKERDKTYKQTSENNQKTIESLKKILHEREFEYLRIKAELDAKLNNEKHLREVAESELRSKRQEVNRLKLEITELQQSMESSIKHYTETLEAEKNMWHKRFTDLETSSEAALQRARAVAFDKQQALENNIIEISEKQAGKLLALSEKLERSMNDNTVLESQLYSAQGTIAKLQKENSVLVSEVTEPAKKLSALHEEISNERLISQRLRQEYSDEVRASDKLRLELEKVRLELNASKQAQTQLIDKYEEELRQQKTKVNSLKNVLNERDRNIDAARSEERDRAKLLYSAFNKYMNSLDGPKKSE